MKANFPIIQQDRQKAYDLLVEGDTNWTSAGVPFINFDNGTGDVNITWMIV